MAHKKVGCRAVVTQTSQGWKRYGWRKAPAVQRRAKGRVFPSRVYLSGSSLSVTLGHGRSVSLFRRPLDSTLRALPGRKRGELGVTCIKSFLTVDEISCLLCIGGRCNVDTVRAIQFTEYAHE
jgi:hypothetical protein